MKSTTFSWIPDDSQFGSYEVNLMTHIRDSLNNIVELVSRNGCARGFDSHPDGNVRILCRAFREIGATPRINVLRDADAENPDYGLVESQLITRFKETMTAFAHAMTRASCANRRNQ